LEASEIAKLAQLARINIEPEMVNEVTESISSILNLVNELQAADTTDIEPMAHPMDAVQRLRADIITEVVQRDELQANAPAVDKGLFLVPKVID
jgi:aspartyl-tRNA(Asn)/glutamyl-tRNA(Gln) amidotransferase subunit C